MAYSDVTTMSMSADNYLRYLRGEPLIPEEPEKPEKEPEKPKKPEVKPDDAPKANYYHIKTPMHPCPICGTMTRRMVYCSPACSAESVRQRMKKIGARYKGAKEHPCPICGKVTNNLRYCSVECRAKGDMLKRMAPKKCYCEECGKPADPGRRYCSDKCADIGYHKEYKAYMDNYRTVKKWK